ncbi:type II toxin-antitoxin system RelE/ParE family toxin [Patescibacteria group bacterium]|nr:type II toxin-antitoxin system RelE/ParE family toxin [Patescibacteria group bacterium]
MPRKDLEKIFAVFEEMKVDPFSGDIKLMQGEENLYRRRIGNYRIYFRPIKLQHIFDISLVERKQSH